MRELSLYQSFLYVFTQVSISFVFEFKKIIKSFQVLIIVNIAFICLHVERKLFISDMVTDDDGDRLDDRITLICKVISDSIYSGRFFT